MAQEIINPSSLLAWFQIPKNKGLPFEGPNQGWPTCDCHLMPPGRRTPFSNSLRTGFTIFVLDLSSIRPPEGPYKLRCHLSRQGNTFWNWPAAKTNYIIHLEDDSSSAMIGLQRASNRIVTSYWAFWRCWSDFLHKLDSASIRHSLKTMADKSLHSWFFFIAVLVLNHPHYPLSELHHNSQELLRIRLVVHERRSLDLLQ